MQKSRVHFLTKHKEKTEILYYEYFFFNNNQPWKASDCRSELVCCNIEGYSKNASRILTNYELRDQKPFFTYN